MIIRCVVGLMCCVKNIKQTTIIRACIVVCKTTQTEYTHNITDHMFKTQYIVQLVTCTI